MIKSGKFCPLSKEALAKLIKENTPDLRDFQCTTEGWKETNTWGDACQYQESIRYNPLRWELRKYGSIREKL